MRNEEAIEELEGMFWTMSMGFLSDREAEVKRHNEAIQIAIDAIRTQTPMKVTDADICPACGYTFGLLEVGDDYCPDCGQILDWTRTEYDRNRKRRK